MMKKIKTLLLSLFIVTCYAQDKVVDLDSYSAVNVSEGIEVKMIEGPNKAEINMIKGDIDDLEIKLKGETLVIGFRNNKVNFWNNRDAEITLYYNQNITEVSVSSGASLYNSEPFISSEFEVDASSGGSLNLMVDSNEIDVDVSSGASIQMGGESNSLRVDASSGASFKGKKLATKTVRVNASSGAGATVWAEDYIKASASSGGSVRYKGDPAEKELDTAKYSGGSIRKI